jgi:hypothetical protein
VARWPHTSSSPSLQQRELKRVDRLTQLVRDHAVETLQPSRVLRDRLRVLREVRVDRRPQQRLQRDVEAVHQIDQLVWSGRQPSYVDFFHDEFGHDEAKHAVSRST